MRIQRRHTTGARARHRLAIDVILHVARSEYARNIGHRGVSVVAAFGFNVAVRHIDLAFENLRVGCVADGDEHALERHVFGFRFRRAFDANAGHARFIADDFIKGLIPFDAHIAAFYALHQLIDHDRLRAQFVTAMN